MRRASPFAILLCTVLVCRTFAQAPHITSLSATSGVTGTTINVNGSNFGSSQGSSTVAFNGVLGSPTAWSPSGTLITVPVPALATTGSVVVTVGSLASNGVTFTVIPQLLSIYPPSGSTGAVIEVNGTGFGGTQGNNTLTFNAAPASPTLWSDTRLISELPSGISTGPVVITVGGNQSNGVVFTLLSGGAIGGTITQAVTGTAIGGATVSVYLDSALIASTTTASNGTFSVANLPSASYTVVVSDLTYPSVTLSNVSVNAGATTQANATLGSPSITQLTPNTGPVGTTVTISGLNFGAIQGSSAVTVNSVLAMPTIWSATRVSFPVPATAKTGPVLVQVGGVSSNQLPFTVGTGTIAGSVTDSVSGGGIGGATVELLQAGVVQASSTTLSSGSYSVGSLKPSTYDVLFSASAHGTKIVSAVSASAGNTTTQNASLSTPGTVSGTVTSGANPIVGATVQVYQGFTVAGAATTGTNGTYSITTLGSGTYTAVATASGENPVTKQNVTVTAGNATTENFSLSVQPVITYVYDEAGRLGAVVNSSTNAAVYSYDPAGNLLSISQNSSSKTTISEFVPIQGPVTTSVTIYGTGFSSTLSGNTVKFSGTTATVTSASATQLTATVPSGAATGKISVTTGTTVATSAQSFTVTTSNGLPGNITFTPTIGTAGTVVSVSGINFDPTKSNDTARFNGAYAGVSSASAINVSTSVPSTGTSGHVGVSTTLGAAVSVGDFFVPPPPFQSNNVVSTSRMTLGGSSSPNIGTANAVGLVLFDATAGQRASFQISVATGCVSASIWAPGMTKLASAPCNGTSDYIELPSSFPVTGSYTLLVQPSAIGQVTIASYIPNEIDESISPGVPLPITISTPGQNARLVFSQSLGLATVQISSNTSGLNLAVSLLNPDGSVLSSLSSTSVAFNLNPAWLPQYGQYSIFIQPVGSVTGGFTVTLTIAGASVPPPARLPGSVVSPNNSLFSNLVGLFLMNEGTGTSDANLFDYQLAALSGTNPPTWNSSDPSLVFNGGASLSSYVNAGTDPVFNDLTPGKMTIVAKVYVSTVAQGGICEKNDGNTIDSGFGFGWDSTGAVRLTVEKSTLDLHVATVGGVISTGKWLQVAVTWDGTVGLSSAAHLFLDGVEQPKASVDDGEGTIGFINANNQPFRIGNVEDDALMSGSLNGKMAYLAVYKGLILTASQISQLDAQLPVNTLDIDASIVSNAPPITETTTRSGQNVRLAFSAVGSQQASVQITNNNIGSVTVTLFDADGALLATTTSSQNSFSLPLTWLPTTGVASIYIAPAGSSFGNITVGLSTINFPSRRVGSVLDTTNPLARSLAGLFIMNENSGTTDLNLVDAQVAAFSGTSQPTWVGSDPSILFNGGASLNSYLNAGMDSIFNSLVTQQMTIVAKVFVNTIAQAGVCEKNDGNAANGFVFGWDSSGDLTLYVEKSIADLHAITGAGAISSGQWTQVALTWDGTVGLAASATIFVNGVSQPQASSSDGTGTYGNATTSPFRIGNSNLKIPGSLSGKIAYLAVYSGRILAPPEMIQLDTALPIK